MVAKLHHVELRQLRYFIVSAEEGSFRKAAERLCISQPPLGRQIQQLEEELGVTLFHRTPRGLTLTPIGEDLLDRCRDLIDRLQSALDHVDRVTNGDSGSVAIHYSDDFMHGAVLELIGQYQAAHPSVEVTMMLSHSTLIAEQVSSGQVDLGLLTAPLPPTARDLRRCPCPPLPIMAALPTTHPLASRPSIRLAELSEECFLAADAKLCSGFLMQIAQMWTNADIAPRVQHGLWPTQSQVALIGAGMGVTLMAADSAITDPRLVRLVPLEDEGAVLSRYIVTRKQAPKIVSRLFRYLDQNLNAEVLHDKRVAVSL